MQTASARPYLGKSIEMKAVLRSNDVAQRAGLWIRADDIDGTTVAFRNCFSRQAPHGVLVVFGALTLMVGVPGLRRAVTGAQD